MKWRPNVKFSCNLSIRELGVFPIQPISVFAWVPFMRIDHPNQPSSGSSARLGVADSSAVKTSPSSGGVAQQGNGSSDKVHLSGISGILSTSSGLRASQVSQLAQLVRGGGYHVPSSVVSQSLVSETIAGSALSRAR